MRFDTRYGLVLIPVLGLGAALGAAPTSTSQSRVVAEFATPLEGRSANQRHNALLSTKRLNGAVIAPGATFSFTGRVGTWSRDQGYRRAPVSYNGTLIDAWGGGVCQTSTTLYNTALLAGLEVLERHPHRFAPSYVQPGRDAAVAYPYVDLRFRNPHSKPLKIEASLRGQELVVRLVGDVQLDEKPRIKSVIKGTETPGTTRIDRNRQNPRIRNLGKTGYEVETWVATEGRKHLISVDSYPAMNRVIED